jgi:glycosyltransferase involved in cell wall biosynthesis
MFKQPQQLQDRELPFAKSAGSIPGKKRAGDCGQAVVVELPLVSAVVPCRNEEKFIARCLDSIVANDYPRDRLEVLVLDGMSEDKTREIVESYARRYPFIRLVENPKKSIPAAMNTGIRHARGDTVIKMDAHSTYAPNHISGCVRYQGEYQAANVGGVCKMLPGADTKLAQAIVLALASRFGSGNARIKLGLDRPTWADAAAFGCYKKDLLSEIGLFNEKLLGSSDMDMNVRIRAADERILLVPEIVISYYADATLGALWKHNFGDGVWATFVMKFGSKGWSWRHWVPLAFVSSLLASLILSVFVPKALWFGLAIAGTYAVASLGASLQISIHERTLRFLGALPLAFAARHLAFGLGSLLGLALVLLPGEHWKGRSGRKG